MIESVTIDPSTLEIGHVHQVQLGELLLGIIRHEDGHLTVFQTFRASEVKVGRAFEPEVRVSP